VKSAAPGKYEDGNGLRLIKRKDGGGQWVFRYTIHGRRREMGLGGLASVSLKDVREIASEFRALLARDIDPIKRREEQRREAVRGRHLLRDIAREAFESRKAELKGDGQAGRWFSPLELHILAKLGGVPVTDLTQTDIRDTLVPIWHTKAATATKAADRLKIVLDHAAALGLGHGLIMSATRCARMRVGLRRGNCRPVCRIGSPQHGSV